MGDYRDRNVECKGRPDMVKYDMTCGSRTYELTFNDDMAPIWKCNNCGNETPRREPRRAGEKGITKSQQRVIDAIRREVESCERYTLENFKVEECQGYVIVTGDKVYQGAKNSLNDSQFQIFVFARGRVKGSIFPSLGSTVKVDARSLCHRLRIY